MSENQENTNQEQEVTTPEEAIEAEKAAENPMEDKIKDLEEKNAALNEKLLRSLAEIENIRRRSRADLEKAAKFAISNFATDLVVVAENFFMASENAPTDEIEKIPAIKGYSDAIKMTEKELMKILEKNKIKRISPLNEKFDHNFHEAIAQVESEADEGIVVQVIQSGYSIADRLIRPALVGVSKAKS